MKIGDPVKVGWKAATYASRRGQVGTVVRVIPGDDWDPESYLVELEDGAKLLFFLDELEKY